MITIDDLNQASASAFIAQTGGALEGEIWLAERVLAQRPFEDVEGIVHAFATAIKEASEAEKIRLLASHPDLGIKVADSLSEASVREQASAGLDQLTDTEYDTFSQLNTDYKAKFGFPFVICARDHDKQGILFAFEDRLKNDRSTEIEIGIAQIIRIIRLRLLDLVTT